MVGTMLFQGRRDASRSRLSTLEGLESESERAESSPDNAGWLYRLAHVFAAALIPIRRSYFISLLPSVPSDSLSAVFCSYSCLFENSKCSHAFTKISLGPSSSIERNKGSVQTRERRVMNRCLHDE